MQINLYTGRLYGLGFPADMGFNVLLFCTWVGIPHQSPSLCSGLSPGAGRQSPPANHPSFCPRGSSNGIELWEAGPIHLPYWGNEARVLNGFSIQQRDSLVLLWGKFSPLVVFFFRSPGQRPPLVVVFARYVDVLFDWLLLIELLFETYFNIVDKTGMVWVCVTVKG